MAEASRLPSRRPLASHLPLFAFSKMRAVAVVVSLLVVIALLPGLTYAIANSTGGPLYDLKLLGQEARLWLTNSPEAAANLQVSMAEEQMEDIVTALEEGQPVDPVAVNRAEKRLVLAVEAVSQDSDTSDPAPRLRLMNTLQNTHHIMTRLFGAGSDPEFEPLHKLMRSIERAREQLTAGSGQAQGEQERTRAGLPADDQEFGMHGPAQATPGAQDTPGSNQPPASQPGPASDTSGKPPWAPGPTYEATPETTATPTPPVPGQPEDTGGNQEQAQEGPGGNRPEDNHQPGQKGNEVHSRQP
jgi:hypothetical protein